MRIGISITGMCAKVCTIVYIRRGWGEVGVGWGRGWGGERMGGHQGTPQHIGKIHSQSQIMTNSSTQQFAEKLHQFLMQCVSEREGVFSKGAKNSREKEKIGYG